MTMHDSIIGARIGDVCKNEGDSATLEFVFHPSDPTFMGHFPTRPLLPGVYQLEMARVAAETVLGCEFVVAEITKSKFLRPITPGEPIRVALKWTDKMGTIQVRADFSVKGQPAGETIMQLVRNK